MFEIEKIIFIKDKNRVCIFYSNDTLKYVSVEEGKLMLSSLARKENLNKEDIKNWDKIEFCSFKEFENKYQTEAYMRENRTRFLLQKKIEEDKQRERRRKKQSTSKRYTVASILISVGIIGSVAVMGGSCYFLYNKLFNKDSQRQESNKDINSTNADIKSATEITKIINNSDLNNTKRNFVSFLYEYIQNYNGSFASKHIDSNTSTKAAITIDEAISQLMIYKNYDKKQLFDIFGYDNFSSEDIYNTYISLTEQETKAHIIQKESLNKNFIKGKKKVIYDKYEGLMINFNIQNSEERKIEVAKQFWNEVRSDIAIEEADELPENMEVILPIIKAMKKVCKNLDIDEKLNSKELEWYFTECDQKIREKLHNYNVNLNDIATVNKRLGATVVMTLTQIKDTITNQLMSDDIYNIEDYERDISNHKEYKIAINYFKNLEKDSNKDNKNNESKTKQEDEFYDYDNDNSEESKDSNKVESKKKKTQKSNSKKDSKSSNQSEPSDGESSNDDNYDDSYDNSNNDSYNDISNDDETDSNENDDVDSNNGSYNDQEDSENKDNDSAYPDYVKDVTDNETGAYEDFPNLNSKNKEKSSPKVKVKRIQISYK